MLRFPALVLLAAAAVAAVTVPAQADVLRLDPAATAVTFTLDSTFHEVHGRFTLEAGEIVFDPLAGHASGEIVVAAASASTDNARRDRKMHETVLESARFPRIVFTPRRLAGAYRAAGDSAVELSGTLSIHGDAHEVTIPATLHGVDGRLTGAAKLSIPFVEWGMKDPSVLMFRVAKRVDVTLEFVGALEF